LEASAERACDERDDVCGIERADRGFGDEPEREWQRECSEVAPDRVDRHAERVLPERVG